jgi:hypothetical protein
MMVMFIKHDLRSSSVWNVMQAHGLPRALKGEGEGEGCSGQVPTADVKPLTLILSPCARGEARTMRSWISWKLITQRAVGFNP